MGRRRTTALAIISGMALGAGLLVGVPGTAEACRRGPGEQPVRPIAHDATTAATLLRRAAALEAEARGLDESARELDGRSAVLARRARLLRVAASSAGPSERRRLLDQAFELDGRAEDERERAEGRRQEASELRADARSLRQRTAALQGGGGWRKRPTPWASAPSAV